MLRFFRRRAPIPEDDRALLERLAVERQRPYSYDIKESTLGRQLLAADPEEQRAFVMSAVAWLNERKLPAHDASTWPARSALLALLRRRLPFTEDDLVALLDWSISQRHNYWRAAGLMVKAVDGYLRGHPLTPALRHKIAQFAEVLGPGATAAERKCVARLRELTAEGPALPLTAGEAWSDAAMADIAAMDRAPQGAWTALLQTCAQASGSVPSARWTRKAETSREAIGLAAFKEAVLRWFTLVDRPRSQRIRSWPEWQPDPNDLLEKVNADTLKGLAWLCAIDDDAEVARALTGLALSAYRKVPSVGPRCVRLGNACVWALGNMPGTEGIAQLALLRARVKINKVLQFIDATIAAAAERMGLPPEEIEELSAPTYGLQEVGLRREQIGGYTADLVVTGTHSSELRWYRPDGKPQRSTPKMVRQEHGQELREISQALKDVRRMLPAQRDRVECLYLAGRRWTLPVWRERYLDHPLVGTLGRRLIWKFSRADHAASGIWHDGQIVGRDSCVLDWLDDSTHVELWHPMQVHPEVVLEWRAWLAKHEVQQPFKQAHREVYLLTDAERETGTYSNRFAAHIVKQHQFNALCATRGWANKLRVMADVEYPPPTRLLPSAGLRAEYWVEAIGTEYGTDTTAAGTYLYLSTDQVRFYSLDAPQHRAHVGGGGYYTGRYGETAPAVPIPLDQVPPLVFSEVMRDVDLFVGVASVGNDPAWSDGGPQGRYRNYWASYSFGELSETANTRREVLQQLLPRLNIADRCRLSDRFLVVRGDLRTYKIHLGSGNILMEPDDHYLCIVRGQGAAGEGVTGRIFLPFEGDGTLSLILSKAFLLAADKDIKDPTIRRQIGS